MGRTYLEGLVNKIKYQQLLSQIGLMRRVRHIEPCEVSVIILKSGSHLPKKFVLSALMKAL